MLFIQPPPTADPALRATWNGSAWVADNGHTTVHATQGIQVPDAGSIRITITPGRSGTIYPLYRDAPSYGIDVYWANPTSLAAGVPWANTVTAAAVRRYNATSVGAGTTMEIVYL